MRPCGVPGGAADAPGVSVPAAGVELEIEHDMQMSTCTFASRKTADSSSSMQHDVTTYRDCLGPIGTHTEGAAEAHACGLFSVQIIIWFGYVAQRYW